MTACSFRIFVGLAISFRFVGRGIELGTESQLPPSLQLYLEESLADGLNLVDCLYLGVSLPLLVSTIALMVFSRWSRHAFLVLVSMEALLFASSPLVVTGVVALVLLLEAATTGVVLVAAYTTPLSSRFTSKKPPLPERHDLRVLTGVLVGSAIGLLACGLMFSVAFLSVWARHGTGSEEARLVAYALAALGFGVVTSVATYTKAIRLVVNDSLVRHWAGASACVVGGSLWLLFLLS